MPANVRVEGLNAVLRAVRGFGPDANKELREAANDIATRIMAPAFQRRAAAVPSWGRVLSDSIRARRDRIPSVSIGYAKRATTGGASSNVLRYATDTGTRRAGGTPPRGPAPFVRTDWVTAAAREYKQPAMNAYADTLTAFVREWNRGY